MIRKKSCPERKAKRFHRSHLYILLLFGFILFTALHPALAKKGPDVQGSTEPLEGEYNEISPLLSPASTIDSQILSKLRILIKNPNDAALLLERS